MGIWWILLVWSFADVLLTGSAELEELAERRKEYATQVGPPNADLALDGDANPHHLGAHCATPQNPTGQDFAWWMVDLGSGYAIYNVTIYSVRHHTHNLGYISVRVSDSADINEHTTSDQCAMWNNLLFPDASHETLVCEQVMYGRYVSIRRTGGNIPHIMTLCEVLVMGRLIETNCSNCNDEGCVPTSRCSECQTGLKPPECLEVCDTHHYGVNCQHECSANCKDNMCDSKTGHCHCDPGYYDDKCQRRCNKHCKNGICDEDTGNCECESGYYGNKCPEQCTTPCLYGICDEHNGYCDCEPGQYGDHCDLCSEGCEDTCDSQSGQCNCKDWWDGTRCTTEVGLFRIPRTEPTFIEITDWGPIVSWETIRNLPDITKQYYSYVLEYRLEGQPPWINGLAGQTLEHRPEANGRQHFRMCCFQYNTVYEVQVRSVRTLGERKETTGETLDAKFKSNCRVPDQPQHMKITHVQEGGRISLIVTWQARNPRCTRISHNALWYRLSSASTDNWQKTTLNSSFTSGRISDLDPGNYVVKLVVTNNEGRTSSDTKNYAAFLDYDSKCNKCEGTYCLNTAPCQTCTVGEELSKCKQEELAKRRSKHATQLGNPYPGHNNPSWALDGNLRYYSRSFDPTEQHAAWWMVDLGNDYAIYNVTVYSWDHSATLGYISVRVSDSPNISEHTLSDQCAMWNGRFFSRMSHDTLACDQVMYGRYVSIQRTGGAHQHILELAEVMVIGRQINTNCSNCNDDACVRSTLCSECKAGFKAPECREVCDDHRYGINCQHLCDANCKDRECDSKSGDCLCDPGYFGEVCERRCNKHCKDERCDKDTGYCECEPGYYGDHCDLCSEGCEDTCDSQSGQCNCKDWWDGTRCGTEVGVYKIPRCEVTITRKTDSSVLVTWKSVKDLPDDIKQYYSYLLEYRMKGQSQWMGNKTLGHNPGADGTQHSTLFDLQYNTVFEVWVRSVRTLRERTESTEETQVAKFTTRCKAPDKPDMKITHEEGGGKVDLIITWEAPDPRCSRITNNAIQYRLSTEIQYDWRYEDLGSKATSATIMDLDPGDYVVKLTVTNSANLASSDTKLYVALLHFGEVAQRQRHYATQIGTHRDYPADLALDGETNPSIDAGHCASSYDVSRQQAAWWMVDLGNDYAIYNVTIYSSSQYEFALGYISVRVSDKADISEHTVTDQCALWDDDRFPAASKQTLECEQVMYGRYLSIQRTGGSFPHSMVLCEVMVMGRLIETNCSNCNDNDCVPTSRCSECQVGLKSPECLEVCDTHHYGINCQDLCDANCKDKECDSKTGHCPCDPGYYGENCERRCNKHCKDESCDKDTGYCECEPGYYGDHCDLCSEGCEDTCDSQSGHCNCKDWWDGTRCITEVGFLEIPKNYPIAKWLTKSSAVMRWKKITNVPADLSDHYKYVIEYKEETSSSWVEWPTRHSHDPSSDQYQEATLTGLTYNTVYDVRVKSYRVLGDDTEETAVTGEIRFQTSCTIPSKPRNVSVTFLENGSKTRLSIMWKHPKEAGCNNLVLYAILHRLKSARIDSWTTDATLPASFTSHTFELDKGDYVVRVMVTNDGGYGNSNYAKASYKTAGSSADWSFPSFGARVIIYYRLVMGLIVAGKFLLCSIK